MITKKVILLALLGISALNCADAGPKARVEAFLAKSTYQADFQKLGDEEKKQLAKDLDEVVDQINGVKKNVLRTLCAPFLFKDSKAEVKVTTGKMKKAYEEAAAVSASLSPARVHVAPGRLSGSSGSDAPSSAERVHVGRLSLDDAPVASPPRAPVVVPKLAADRLDFFQRQSEQMQLQVAAQKGKKDDAQDKRLFELQAELEALKGPLDNARLALEQATTNKKRTETLSKKAAEDADTAGFIQMSINLDDTALTGAAKEAINKDVTAIFAAGREEVAQKKQELDATYAVTDANAMQVISRLAGANNFKDALFLSRFLAEDYLTRATAARAEAEDANKQAAAQEAHADRLLQELEARFRDLSVELDAMTSSK